MRNFNAWLLALAVCFSTMACISASLPELPPIDDMESEKGDAPEHSDESDDNNNNQPEESMTIDIIIGNSVFRADIEPTETGRAFMERLPLKLDMNELNGNEKYCYGIALPRADNYFDTIAPGDLMLYSGNCIVLFYGPAGGYNYTRIGRLQSVDGLAAALGNGSAAVTFKVE